MVTLRDNVFVDSCSIEDKCFTASLGRDGGIVRLVEVSRNSSFSIFLNREAAVWLVKTVEESLDHGSASRFWRRFVRSGFSILVDIMTNKRGSCLRILKVAQGEGKMILIPGVRRQGLKKFMRTVDVVL